MGGVQLIVLGTVISRIWVELKATVSSPGDSQDAPEKLTRGTQGTGRLVTLLQCCLGFPGVIWERNEVLHKVVYMQA